MKVDLVWVTPEADKLIGYMARVSNPKASPDDSSERLIKYLIDHKHWSPFEMASMCVSIETTRDIGRQILRHSSFHFQEFSQRYSAVEQNEPVLREVRLQDTTNRQNSIATGDNELAKSWEVSQFEVYKEAFVHYHIALKNGVAKEVARALLPEGLTASHMYMSGTIRDWIHYLQVRTGVETQKEHRDVANAIAKLLAEVLPNISNAAGITRNPQSA